MTTSSKEEAQIIVQRLLETRLIACGNIVGPVSSVFRWSGKVERVEEYLVLLKSRKDLFGKVAEIVKTLNSYEVPEILALEVVNGSRKYLDWFKSSLMSQSDESVLLGSNKEE